MGLLELFVTACVPVFNMLLVTGVGSFLATDFAGILGKDARKHLNNVSDVKGCMKAWSTTNTHCPTHRSLNFFWIVCLQIVFYVFNPSLVAIYLAKTITTESLAKLWVLSATLTAWHIQILYCYSCNYYSEDFLCSLIQVVHASEYSSCFYFWFIIWMDCGKSYKSTCQAKRPHFGLLFCW